MHFPKTGGTTLSEILDREFGVCHRRLSFFRLKKPDELGNTHVPENHVWHKPNIEDLELDWHFGETDLIDVLGRNEDIRAISRHGMVIGPSTIDAMMTRTEDHNYRLFPMFFVRRFFPWHISLYFQQRRDPEYMVHLSCDPEVMVAKTGTLNEYTRFCVSISGSHRRHKIMYNWTADDANKMLARIELYQIGLVERYNESLVVMEDALGVHFRGLDLSYGSPRNVDMFRKGGAAAQCLRDLEQQMGPELVDDLAQMGAWSDNLYDRLEEELDSRISCVSNFRGKLEDFKSRCRARSTAAIYDA